MARDLQKSVINVLVREEKEGDECNLCVAFGFLWVGVKLTKPPTKEEDFLIVTIYI